MLLKGVALERCVGRGRSACGPTPARFRKARNVQKRKEENRTTRKKGSSGRTKSSTAFGLAHRRAPAPPHWKSWKRCRWAPHFAVLRNLEPLSFLRRAIHAGPAGQDASGLLTPEPLALRMTGRLVPPVSCKKPVVRLQVRPSVFRLSSDL